MGKVSLFFLVILALIAGSYFYRGDFFPFDTSAPRVFGAEDKVKIVNNWFPKTKDNKNTSDLNINAGAAILVNYESGEVLFARNSNTRLPAASTIKIMTALVALENKKLGDVFVVSKKAFEVGEDSMGLSEGEKLTLEDLLYGVMLPSGNDAAVAIAEGVIGSEDAFVRSMNVKAKELGLSDTKFVNSSGLDVDAEKQYTTAYDLVTIARYTWDKFPVFRRIASTEHVLIEATEEHKAYDLYNDTNLLTTYPGVRGIKPGFTWEAGLCLVTYVENDGVRLLGVILGSDNRRFEMKELLDYGFGKYGVKVAHPILD